MYNTAPTLLELSDHTHVQHNVKCVIKYFFKCRFLHIELPRNLYLVGILQYTDGFSPRLREFLRLRSAPIQVQPHLAGSGIIYGTKRAHN